MSWCNVYQDHLILFFYRFLLVVVAHSIANSTISAVFVLLVDFAIEQGYSRDNAVIILTVQAVFAMLARYVV